MKKIALNLMMFGVAGWLVSAAAQDAPDGNNPPPPPAVDNETNAPETAPPAEPPMEPPGSPGDAGAPGGDQAPPNAAAASAPAASNGATVILPGPANARPSVDGLSQFVPPEQPVGTNNPDALLLNFRNAPLEMVLHYLSDAAGFIIVLDARVSGTVNVISGQPVTRDEAVELLNVVLNKNGYAAIRNGRTLTIVDRNDAKTRNIPVRTGGKPEDIPNNMEIVTQIIPVRFVEARQLVSDLSLFVSPQATIVANEAGNAIVITDTQQNIRHLAEIIRAVDGSAEAETEVRVFRLKYASPTDVASELSSIFPSGTSGGSPQAPIRFGGAGGRGGGGGPAAFFRAMAGGNSGGTPTTSDRVQKASQVNAVADARTQSVIVTAPKDLMSQIADMMKELDVPSTRDQQVFVFRMSNGDPQQVAQVLQNMFQTSGQTRGGSGASSLNSALQQRSQNTTTQMGTSQGSTFLNTGTTGRGGR